MNYKQNRSVLAGIITGAKAKPSKQRIKGLDVLVIDTDEESAHAMARRVYLWGHEVRIALTASAALEEIQKCLPHVVLLNTGGGAHQSREKRPTLIALGDYGKEEARCCAKEWKIDFVVIKKADLEILPWVL